MDNCGICWGLQPGVCDVIECLECLKKRMERGAAEPAVLWGRNELAKRVEFAEKIFTTTVKVATVGRKASTMMQYRRSINHFASWARSVGQHVLPARAHVIQAFLVGKHLGIIDTGSGKKGVGLGRLQTYVASLAAWHEGLGITTGIIWRPTEDLQVTAFVKGVKRQFVPRMEMQRAAISSEAVERCLLTNPTTTDLLYRQLVVALAFLSCSRVSECLSVIWREDATTSDVVLPAAKEETGTTVVKLRSTKTTAEGEILEKFVVDRAAPGGVRFSVLVREFKKKVGLVDGEQFLLGPPDKNGARKRCTAAMVKKMGMEIMEENGEPNEGITTHSFRRGGAGWLLEQGATIQQIKDCGGWKSDSVLCYLKRKKRAIACLSTIGKRQVPEDELTLEDESESDESIESGLD